MVEGEREVRDLNYGETFDKFLLDGDIVCVPNSKCPRCYEDWDFKSVNSECVSCGLAFGASCGCLNLQFALQSLIICADIWCKLGRNETHLSLQQPWICLGSMSIHSLDLWSGKETVQFMWFGLWGQLWLYKFALQSLIMCRYLVQIWPE